jgi:predicted O-methyltransferase YrrM
MNLVFGKCVTQAVSVAAHLRLADHLKDGPRTAEALAPVCEANADALHRLLRALATVGVFVEHPDRTFSLTPVGECLRSDAPTSLASMAKFFGEGWHSAAWADLLTSVRTGESAFARVHGEPAFAWVAKHPRESQVFNEAMTSISTMSAFGVASTYDLSTAKTIVDIGGGHGFFLSTLLLANPNARGVLFDLPHIVEGARQPLAAGGLAERCEIVGGDFFESVPTGGDVYTLKHIIHDWDDDDSVKILSRVAAVLPAGGRVVLVEAVLPPAGVPSFGKILDLEMLVVSDGGRERTEAEYARLFERAGLRLVRIVPTPSPMSILEASR